MFTGEDPVKAGLVASLNQPGGNVTGISTLSTDIGSKRLGLLHELIPNAATIALLQNPKFPDVGHHLQDVQTAAHSLHQQIRVFNAANEDEIDSAFYGYGARAAGWAAAEPRSVPGQSARADRDACQLP